MGTEITPATVGIWYIQLTEMSDYLGTLDQTGPDLFVFTYRFRYYDPDEPNNEPFSGKDQKSWYEATIPGSREEVILAVRQVIKKITEVYKAECDEVLVIDGNIEEFFEVLKRRDWLHLQEASA